MKKTQYRRLFKSVVCRNPNRNTKRRVPAALLQRELEQEAVEESKPMRFCGHVLVNGTIEPALADQFVVRRRLEPHGSNNVKTNVVDHHD